LRRIAEHARETCNAGTDQQKVSDRAERDDEQDMLAS
jgi:hypothetical protein